MRIILRRTEIVDIFDMAHKTYRRLKTCLFRPNGCNCHACSTALGTTYLKERLYAVRCEKCNTITLIEARNPLDAESTVAFYRR